ncbi:putative nuclease HARBI1 [Sinocyclocheilus rhinocerous]|uniref:putative nuclease HARBI1 n=1 Tax=Sinocyclocheilus rhinocerous TaxID=307959 RepID=UPI0007B9C698|nr:PREDICTED: putative nuclease HARBI1 [Sinocyclocheilus rhinocerous]
MRIVDKCLHVNRKSFHSINVQMICDADCLITNLEAKWPGSVHDSRVFRASRIYQRLSLGEFSGVLLGDKGYACETFLLTPKLQHSRLTTMPMPERGLESK